MAKNDIILEIKAEDKLRILFLGDEFPFINEILRQKLEENDCKIYTKFSKIKFDYILIFGKGKNVKESLRFLKHGGKILALVSDENDQKTIKENIPIVLSLTESMTSDTLAEQILHKLFSAKPYELSPEEIKKSQKNLSSKNKKKFKISRKTKIIFLLLVLLISPFAIFGASLFLSIKDLTSLRSENISIEQQEKTIERARKEFAVSKVLASGFTPMSSFIFPEQTKILEEDLNILEKVLLSGEEGISLEKIVREEGQNFFSAKGEVLDQKLSRVKGKLFTIDNYLASAEISVKKLEQYKKNILVSYYWQDLQKIEKARRVIKQSREMVTVLPDLLGFEKKKTYLLLFQNNFELRPTGGFIGSYGVLTLENGVFSDLEIRDVYDADGQLKGQVEPPKPIAEILNQPNWYLRDSNWDPDFAYSADQAEWFLQKETGEKFDGVIAIDLYFVQNLLKVFGEVYVVDYQASVTADDFFFKLQADVHDDFFAGSTKKKDLLSSLASSLMIEFKERKDLPYLSLFQEILDSLDQKNMLVYVHSQKVQQVIDGLGWSGRVLENDEPNSDYFMLVEANLGVNKVNYNIEREVVLNLSVEQDVLRRKIAIYFSNKSDSNNSLTSGVYKNYMRVLLPQKAKIDRITVAGKDLDLQKDVDLSKYQNKLSAGFLVEISPKEQKEVVIDYRLAIQTNNSSFSYQLLVQKQPGIDKYPLIFKVKENGGWVIKNTNISTFPFSAEIERDRLLIIDFEREIK